MSVKQKRRGRPKGSQVQLSAETILNQAKNMMLELGKMPSVRALATGLNVDAMAIYHYFTNKNALQEAIVVSLIEEVYQPQDNGQWQQELSKLCFSYVSLLHQYPGLLETLLKMETSGPAEVFMERFEQILTPLALADETKKDAIDLLADYLHGFALAMNCQPSCELTLEMMQRPLNFYFQAFQPAQKA
tara:strand:- start:4226 stop:4792 length:567 start_codon:yes stop_codon:yes gene_type:complete